MNHGYKSYFSCVERMIMPEYDKIYIAFVFPNIFLKLFLLLSSSHRSICEKYQLKSIESHRKERE